jgi:hypothetical protein
MINAAIAKKNAIEAQEIQKLEAIRQELERKSRFATLATNTITFCDSTLSSMIDEESSKGNNSLTLNWGRDKYNEFSDVCKNVKEYKEYYANGDSSFSLVGNPIHVPTMVDYLLANGYKVEQLTWTYKCYGSGCQKGTRIRIQWNP